MGTYTVTTNFANKDTLPSGSADKVIKGSEFTTEFNNIATAISTKAESSSVTSLESEIIDLQTQVESLGGNAGGSDSSGTYVPYSDTDFIKLTQVEVSSGEINRLSGIRYNIQDQLDNLETGSGGSYVSVTDPDYLKLTQVNASSTELNYLDGATSNIQAQLDSLGANPDNSYVSLTDADYVKLTQVDASATELNYVDGVTSNIQSQLNALLGRIEFLEEQVLGGGQ